MPFVETPLAKDLDVAEQKVRYDSSAKRIIAHKPIIARIAKHVVPEVSQYTIKEIEGFINNVEVGKVYL